METDKKILLVEDDPDIATLVQRNLRDEGYQIDHVDDGLVALSRLEREPWDAVILDLMLPNTDGLEICRRIRMMARYLPVIIISARASESQRVLGLETGADDYLVKPFSVLELVARVNGLFRRQQAMSQSLKLDAGTLKSGNLTIDPLSRDVLLNQQPLDLTPREFDLLYFFARHPGEVYSRLALLENVWGYRHEGYEHTVNTHINRLRLKVERDPAEPLLIQTVWGKGYKFVSSGPGGEE